MRRIAPLVLIGLGAFFLVTAVMLRFYAYPRLAVAPIDQSSVTKLEAKDATIFDVATLEEVQTDLSIQSRTVGDVKKTEKAGGDTRVWVGTTSIRRDDGTVVSRSVEQKAFDAHTAEAVNCCGNFTETTEGEREDLKASGLVFKFPFATEKKTYKLWDGSLGTTVDAKYVKEDEVKGLDVYVFETDIPPTVTGQREVPGSLVGEPDTPTVQADNVYSNQQTYYVEPVTGAIINRIDHQRSTVAVDGEDQFVTTEAEIRYTDAQIKEGVDDISTKASLLSKVHGLFPLLALLLGLLLLAGGLFLFRLDQRNDDDPPAGGRRRSDAEDDPDGAEVDGDDSDDTQVLEKE